MPITKAQVKAAVKDIVKTLTEEVDNHNDWIDRANEEVDRWWSNEIGGGRITEMSEFPQDESDIRHLHDAITVMQAAIENGWGIETDYGLWEGLPPFQALISQAYFTMESAVAQQEPRDLP